MDSINCISILKRSHQRLSGKIMSSWFSMMYRSLIGNDFLIELHVNISINRVLFDTIGRALIGTEYFDRLNEYYHG